MGRTRPVWGDGATAYDSLVLSNRAKKQAAESEAQDQLVAKVLFNLLWFGLLFVTSLLTSGLEQLGIFSLWIWFWNRKISIR